MDNVIEIRNLSKKFDKFQLNNINIDLPKGSIMGFIGENGAGKTTTIRLILNQLKKDTGSIHVFGLDHGKDEIAIKENIGVVLDECHFHENLAPFHINKILKQIYQKWDETLFFSMIERFQIPPDQVTKKFSKGMKMKLSIAAALAHHPKLLILDEATSGLDPVIRNEVLDIFLEFIQDEDHSIIFSSHITSDLEKVADYITFIHNGSIIFSESKDVLLYDKVDQVDIIGQRKSHFGYEILVKNKETMLTKYHDLAIDQVKIEDIMLFYSKGGIQQ